MAKGKLVSALDIGSSKITALVAQVRSEESSRLHIIGVASAPSLGVRKGQIVDIEAVVSPLTEAVEAAERMAGYNLTQVWVAVGGSHISSQNSHGVVAVAQPRGEIDENDVQRVLEAARAISLPAASEIIHVLPKYFTVDSQEGVSDPVGMSGIRLEVDTHIITGSTPVIKNLTKCVSEVGCDIAGLVYSGLASAKSVLSDTDEELGAVVIDIGGGTMSTAVYVENALHFSQVFPVGSINVTKDLAAGLSVSLESAEKIKIHLAKNQAKEEAVDLSPLQLPEGLKTVSYKTVVEGIIRPRLNEMFQVISSELKKNNLTGLTPAGAVLTGGGALTVGIVESGKRILGLPVRIGTPQNISGLIDDVQTPAYAASVGLLKYALSETATPSSARSFSFPQLPRIDKLPLAGALGKIIHTVKSLLP